MSDSSACLIIRSLAPDARFRAFVEALDNHQAVISATRLHEVETLEPGTVPAHTLIIDYPGKAEARRAWESMPLDLLAQPAPPLVLLSARVPDGGFEDPEIPTKANVGPVKDGEPVYLLIEGTATDQDRMDTYRGIILPMMFDRHAYYTVFELGGAIEVLSGDWDEAIFAISRWPNRDAARDFWLSNRYQNDAIPLRLDIGKFAVAMVPERGPASR